MVEKEVRYDRERHTGDSAGPILGVIAVIAVLALIGWGVWVAMTDDVRTGTVIDDGQDNTFIDINNREDRNPDVVNINDGDGGTEQERIIEREQITTTIERDTTENETTNTTG